MRILMVSAEGPPLQRAGALVDVIDALPHELRNQGHEVSVALPFYRQIREHPSFAVSRAGGYWTDFVRRVGARSDSFRRKEGFGEM